MLATHIVKCDLIRQQDLYITVDLPPDKREFVPAHVTDIFSGLESAWSFKRRMDGLPYKKRGKRRRRDSNGELIDPGELSEDEVDEGPGGEICKLTGRGR